MKSTSKNFPHKGYNNTILSDAVEIKVRPQNLSFFEKLFGKKTQKEYYPIGNLREFVADPKPSFEEFFKTVVYKVK